MHCYKVRAKTTDSSRSTTTGPKNDEYVECEDGVIFVFGKTPAAAQKVVHPDWIEEIQWMGIGKVG